MSRSEREFFTDPTRLAQGFLHAKYVWEPQYDKADARADDGLAPLPAAGTADYALRWWCGDFYRYEAGRYLPVSQADMQRRLVGLSAAIGAGGFKYAANASACTTNGEAVSALFSALRPSCRCRNASTTLERACNLSNSGSP